MNPTSGAAGKAVLALLVLAAVAAMLCWFCDSGPPSSPSSDGHEMGGGEPVVEQANEPRATPASAPDGGPAPGPDDSSSPPPSTDLPESAGAEIDAQAEHSEAPTEALSDDEDLSWDGSWLTQEAMGEPDMSALSPTDAGYDAKTEAQQLFHPFEMDLRANQPLEPVRYKRLLGQHKGTNAAALRRVTELNRAGHKAQGKELYQEWSRLFELYRREAYAGQENRPAPASPAPR